jgi:hypothetical protein
LKTESGRFLVVATKTDRQKMLPEGQFGNAQISLTPQSRKAYETSIMKQTN